MKKIILLLGFILSLSCAYCTESQIRNVGYRPHHLGGFNRPHFGAYNYPPYGRFNTFNPFNRNRFGIFTGITPPVNYGITSFNSPNGYYTTNPFYSDMGFSIKNFFNRFKRNNNYPVYNPTDPLVNGNYTPTPNSSTIPLFNSGPSTGGQFNNGWNNDGITNSTGGATVTIID